MTTPTLIAPTRAERDTVTSWRVERLLDMTRTMVNVGSDVVTTIVVDHFTKLEHEPGAAGSHA